MSNVPLVVATAPTLPQVLLVGKPNCGKSLLFNRLTGIQQKVANFPGVTVEVKRARAHGIEFVDLPALYSLVPVSADEAVAVEQFQAAIAGAGSAAFATPAQVFSVVLVVLDATRLERSLVLALETLDLAHSHGVPCMFALNMSDELRAAKLSIDAEGLSLALRCPVIAVSARTGEGLSELRRSIAAATAGHFAPQAAVSQVGISAPERARLLAQRFAPACEPLLARQTKIDAWTLSSVTGMIGFLVVMSILFQAVFTWAQPVMDLTQTTLKAFGVFAAGLMPLPMLGDFVKDGLLGGMSAVVVFVPQIFMLTFLIGMLEDSGYLARAAMLCHRPLSLVGLSGKSFVPLLSGHACAIPAIMAARTIESPRARWLTWMAIPLMACSARLPIYGLLIAALIPDTRYVFGLFGQRGLTLLALYLFGILSGLAVSAMTNRLTPKTKKRALPMVLELPPYRLPSWRPLAQRSMQSSWAFVRRAGGTIFAVSVVVWVLGYFPGGDGQLESSWLATVGRLISPLFAPLGLDWKVAVAVLTSFLAREVFVGTLGVLFGIQDAKEHATDLVTKLQASGITLASGLALLVFFAVALQCVSTLAVLRKESGSQSLPIIMMTTYTAAAYLLALLVHSLVLFAAGA